MNANIYDTFYTALSTKPNKIGDKTPSFLIYESIKFFERKEEFEKCALIKNFFDRNISRVVKITREDYMLFGYLSF